jgi:hypothetical protein
VGLKRIARCHAAASQPRSGLLRVAFALVIFFGKKSLKLKALPKVTC